ncbi:hypothetical protein [Bacillus sp. 196mf]|uniref:hypothetical protein n=1 Tax=Bacillus sp. 196mf TaxID=1761754 RepID=UPI000D7D0AE8|nr:hypothetical protein [Bacillus sp. 196mf]PYE88288.1 hypothetical protein ATL10_10504 [Bacillus sp. 196mf]
MPGDSQNPNSGEINWDAVVQAGAEALASYVGGQIGAIAVAAVFEANRSSEPSFERVIADLRESIRQDIENTFIREYAGRVIGYEQDLAIAIRTNNQDTVDRIRSGSLELINILLQYNTFGILINLVRVANVFLLALEIQANMTNNPEYKQIRREKAAEYSPKVNDILTPYESTIRTSFDRECLIIIDNAKNAVCHDQFGFTYRLRTFCQDNYTDSYAAQFEENNCKTFPFNGINSGDSMTLEHSFTPNDKRQHDSFVRCEHFRTEAQNRRNRALEIISIPIRETISKWNLISQ